jgi:hypothetical protein
VQRIIIHKKAALLFAILRLVGAMGVAEQMVSVACAIKDGRGHFAINVRKIGIHWVYARDTANRT